MSALLGRIPSAVGYQPTLADRHGRAAGADHLDQQGLDHLGAGDLRARRRLDRPGAGDLVRPPRRDDDAQPRDLRARHLSGGRPARLRPAACSPRRSSARSITRPPAPSRRRCSATRACRTSSPSSAWTSFSEEDKLTVSRARKIQRFLSQPFHVAEVFTGIPGKFVQVEDTVRSFKAVVERRVRPPAGSRLLHGRRHRGSGRQGREAGAGGVSPGRRPAPRRLRQRRLPVVRQAGQRGQPDALPRQGRRLLQHRLPRQVRSGDAAFDAKIEGKQ